MCQFQEDNFQGIFFLRPGFRFLLIFPSFGFFLGYFWVIFLFFCFQESFVFEKNQKKPEKVCQISKSTHRRPNTDNLLLGRILLEIRLTIITRIFLKNSSYQKKKIWTTHIPIIRVKKNKKLINNLNSSCSYIFALDFLRYFGIFLNFSSFFKKTLVCF
jgi:hypothetical protein